MKLLLVEDDRESAKAIKRVLDPFYIVEHAYSGKEAEYMAQTNVYDTMIVDYMLPDIDGIEVCKKVRHEGITTPVIILTGDAETKNKVRALKGGADDYVTKPFDPEELRARVEAVLRRTSQSLLANTLTVGNLTLNLSERVAIRDGIRLKLRRKEMDLLEYLMRNVGRVVTRSMILDHVWDSSYESFTNLVDVHIKYLRDKVDRNFPTKIIKTVHGYGYKIEA